MIRIRTSAFLNAFREPDESLSLRAFKPKKAPDTPENSAQKWTTTLFDLIANRELLVELRRKNQNCGIYFVVNRGGDSDAEITRYTAFFAEADNCPISEQHTAFDSAPLQPSIRVETRNSVHAYWSIAGECVESEWRDVQRRLIAYFDSDPKIINPSRVMRVPGFDHLHLNGNGLERKKVSVHTFEPERRFTVAEMCDAFPAPKPENVSQGQQTPTNGTFEYHEDRHAELCQRIMSRGKRNSKGNYDARGICHHGTGNKGLVYFPSSGAIVCNAEPKCDYFSILRAEGLPDDHLPSREGAANKNGNQSPQSDASLAIVKMIDVEREEVEWLWEPYIPLKKLTLLEGDPGIGKSWITAALACAVSRGRGLPGIGAFAPGNVLMLSAEDGLADTLRPRLDAMGADVGRIFALNQPLTFDEVGLLSLAEALIKHRPRLLTVDPLFAYTGGTDIHRANECRTVTARLALVAEKGGCAIFGVRHLGKSRGMGHALNAGIGSIDLLAAARSVLLAGKDPDDEKNRAIAQIKNNLAPHGPAIGFTLEGGEFSWTGESDLTSARLLSYAPSESERPALDEACEFLRDELGECDVDVATLKANARRAGISEITLRRAKDRLNIKAKKVGGYFGGKKSRWVWCLPGERLQGEDQIEREERLAIQEEGRAVSL
jgi:hypothetical protein